MKKFMIPILMLCLGYAGMTKAANTDISSLNNVIYIEPFAASQGNQVVMSIKMKNTVAIRGFQCDLYLPDGVTAATTAKGKIIASLTADRLPDDDEHTLTLSEQGDGSIRFLCGSLYDETFTGTDGEIATLTINIDGGVANGDYPIYLRTMKLTETDISNFYETDEIETTLTIGAAGYTILDETSTVAPTAAEGVNVKVLRTIKANEWSTLCLPFAMTEAQVKEAFGDDVELGDFIGYDTTKDAGDNIESISVNFNTVTAIEANHPYIIKVSSAITEFTVDGVDIAPTADPKVSFGYNTGKKPVVYHPIDFIGTYVADFDFYNAATCFPLFLSGNKFYYATDNTQHMKAFRAFFDFDDYLPEADVPSSSRISMTFDNSETTGVQSLKRENTSHIYDLQGRRVEEPAKGVYIKNNKKVVIK